MPDPKSFKTKDEFISVCIPQLVKEGKEQSQAAAVCNSMWDKKELQDEPIPGTAPEPSEPPKKKGKVELLAEIKKLLEKNGLTITDDDLLSIMDKMQIQGMSLKQRVNLFELSMIDPVEDEQKILVFPKGKHWIEQYKQWLVFDDKFYKNVAKNFDDVKLNKPYIDKDHEYGQSYGDILGYEIDAQGMYFKIKLNNDGVELIKQRKYRYISPSFGDVTDTTKEKHNDWIATISLTNIPAFLGVIPELQKQIQLELNVKNGGKKKMEFVALTNFLELQNEASPEAILEAVKKLSESLKAALAEIDKLTGANEDQAKQIEQKDQAINEMNKNLTAIETEKRTKEADEVIKLAVEKGQYCVSEKFLELKKAEYIKDPAKIKTELSLIPENKLTGQQSASGAGETNIIELSEEDKKLVLDMGYDLNEPKQKKLVLDTLGERKAK